MAKINQNELKELRESFREEAIETAETLNAILDVSNKAKQEAERLITKFNDSQYSLSKVTDRVINKHTTALAGLKDIHNALHKVQELSEYFRAILIPKDLECLNDGKIIWDECSSRFTGSLEVIAVLQTNTDKERELYYIFSKSLTAWSYLRANNQQMESYEKYITNQIFGFNRLDSLIQKLENIKANELFSDLRDDDIMNKDETDLGFNNNEDTGEFESIKARKKRSRRKPLGKRLSKIRG